MVYKQIKVGLCQVHCYIGGRACAMRVGPRGDARELVSAALQLNCSVPCNPFASLFINKHGYVSDGTFDGG